MQACPDGVATFEKARSLQPWAEAAKGNTYVSSFELGYVRGLYLRASGAFAACARETSDPHAHDWLVLLSLETAMPPNGIFGAAWVGYLRGATLKLAETTQFADVASTAWRFLSILNSL